jgi:hypothetical protein
MKSSLQYGVDIGATRSDDLDRLFLLEIAKQKNPEVLNIGSGNANQSRKMSSGEAIVTSVDIVDYSEDYSDTEVQPKSGATKFIHADALTFLKTIPDNTYDFACAQRMIHYLPYHQAQLLLEEIRRTTEHSLHISVTGIESAIGIGYGDKNKEAPKRFCALPQEEREKFHITEPICLYTQDEFKKLLENSGWDIEKIWTSAFGNHKAVCIRRSR